jgi:hypothetical protein
VGGRQVSVPRHGHEAKTELMSIADRLPPDVLAFIADLAEGQEALGDCNESDGHRSPVARERDWYC